MVADEVTDPKVDALIGDSAERSAVPWSGVNVAVRQGRSSSVGRTSWRYCSFAYSALACFRMGMSESASFQRVRKSL